MGGKGGGKEEGMSRERNEPCSTAGGSEPVSHWAALDTSKKRRREPRRTGASVAQTHHSLERGSVFCCHSPLLKPPQQVSEVALSVQWFLRVSRGGETTEKMPPRWLGGERSAAVSLHQSLVITRS